MSSTSSTSPSPSEKNPRISGRRYTPAHSSPLNPETTSCYQIPPSPSLRDRPQPSSPRRQLSQTSPTQRLLRQKAAAAWRAETMRQSIRSQTCFSPGDDDAQRPLLPGHYPDEKHEQDSNHPQTATAPAAWSSIVLDCNDPEAGDLGLCGPPSSKTESYFSATAIGTIPPPPKPRRQRGTSITGHRIILGVALLGGLGLIQGLLRAFSGRPPTGVLG